MCGICGAYSPTPFIGSEVDNIRKLLILNSFRGIDSTGMMSWHRDGDKYYHEKDDVHPFVFDLINSRKVYKEVFNKKYPNLLGFHCRAATVGHINQENAHPFQHEHIIGMHNGTVLSSFENKADFDTDSEAIIHNIAHMGIDDAIKCMKFGAPAYAIVYLDTREGTLNFIRNSQRPLSFIRRNRVLYWSSDIKDLKYAFVSYATETKDADGFPTDTFVHFQPDTLYTMNTQDVGNLSFTTREIKSEYSYSNNNYGRGTTPPFVMERQQTTTSYGKNTPGTHTSVKDGVKDWDYSPIKPFLLGYDVKEWDSIAFTDAGFNGVYAFELGKFIPRQFYKTLCLWRLKHHVKFIELCKERWITLGFDKTAKIRRNYELGLIPMSQNQFKRMLRKGRSEYLSDPWFKDGSNKTLHIKFLPNELDLISNKTNNVVNLPVKVTDPTLNDDLPFTLEDENEYFYGKDNLPCTQLEYLQKTDKGCAYCSNPVDENEYIFWMNNSDFLCEACQDGIILDKDPDMMQCFSDQDLAGLQEFYSETFEEDDDDDTVYAVN